jgi:CHAT domain-containing protein
MRDNQGLFLSLVWRHLAGSADAVRSAVDLILRRKALGAEALAAQRDAVLGGRYPHLREAFDQLNLLRQRIAQKLLAGPAPGETPAAHEQTLAGWRDEQQQGETALARQIPEMNLQQQKNKANHRAVALALPEGVVLVEFVRFHVFDFHAVRGRDERQWQPARYLAFVPSAGQPEQVQMIDLGEADPIERIIATFRAGVLGDPTARKLVPLPRPGSACETAAAVPASAGGLLRQMIFDPLRPALGDSVRLLLCPDGDLARLPFEVLPDREAGKRLLDTYRISYLATGRDLMRCGQPATQTPGPALVAADPDFDLSTSPGERGCVSAPREDTAKSQRLSRGADATPLATRGADATPLAFRRSRDINRAGGVSRLPGTRREGERIAALLGVEPVLDRVLDQPLRAIRSPRIVHLATHGFFLEDQPHDSGTGWPGLGAIDRLSSARFENPLLRSGLLLAGFNSWRSRGDVPAEAEDGMLTAEDVTGMDLLDTELVVLSACETGLGQVHVGEGVFGLRRAFALAGAKTLVMNLWKVPDEQTQELMVDFYSRILRGEGRAEALRQAQLALLLKYPDPYYWGAFICQGDPGPLPTAEPGQARSRRAGRPAFLPLV